MVCGAHVFGGLRKENVGIFWSNFAAPPAKFGILSLLFRIFCRSSAIFLINSPEFPLKFCRTFVILEYMILSKIQISCMYGTTDFAADSFFLLS